MEDFEVVGAVVVVFVLEEAVGVELGDEGLER